MDVIILCHTEYGRVEGCEVIYRKDAVEGVTGGVPGLVSIADRYGARVTFAVMPEVAEHFPQSTGHEIGLHVHPGWQAYGHGTRAYCVGDRYLRARCPTAQTSTVLRDYGYDEQQALIGTGKDRIAAVLGTVPKVFVAGRWSINADTVSALVQEGFTHDCSAVPGGRAAHYDWSRLPRICMPYRPRRDDYQQRGDTPLLIVPVARALAGATVTPELAPLVGLPWLKACFEEYYRQRLPLFHICLHSPSMTDPYFAGVMEGLLRFIAAHDDVTFRFASEAREAADVHPRADARPYLAGLNRNMLNAVSTVAARMSTAVRSNAGR